MHTLTCSRISVTHASYWICLCQCSAIVVITSLCCRLTADADGWTSDTLQQLRQCDGASTTELSQSENSRADATREEEWQLLHDCCTVLLQEHQQSLHNRTDVAQAEVTRNLRLSVSYRNRRRTMLSHLQSISKQALEHCL